MSEHRRLSRSIFFRLLAVMVAMALLVPFTVGIAILVVLRPALNRTTAGMLDVSAELLADEGIDLARARAIAGRHDLGIRYQGPQGSWATDDRVPSPPALTPLAPGVRSGRCGDECRLVVRPDGGAYVFVSHLDERLRTTHDVLVVVLTLVIVLLVAAAHAILRRGLAPLQGLRRGVAAVAAGDLDASVPRHGDDELGELADAFNGMVGRVREMVRSRERLLQDVSHELRSPLTRMRVALALWRERELAVEPGSAAGPPGEEDGEPRRRLERNVAEMERMVTELLELERLRAGRGLTLGRHDLVEIVRDAVLAFGDRPPGVVLEAAPAPGPVQIDPDRVRSVLNNVLENALRFAPAEGRPVRVSVEEGEGGPCVRVEDDGPGIPPDDLPRIFEPFFRVDRSRARSTGGYGLGLSLCRRIMEAHGGAIEARNRPGGGAEFTLTFVRNDR